MWTDNYIGMPFKCDGKDRTGLDCWGLVALVYKEQLGIELPLYKGVFTDLSQACLRRVAATMKYERRKWHEVKDPQLYDVIMLRSGEYAWHVGLVINKREMLHVEVGIDSVVEEFTGRQWKDRIEGFYRYAR
jgi:cell wall-associated NlpC family hydrolase